MSIASVVPSTIPTFAGSGQSTPFTYIQGGSVGAGTTSGGSTLITSSSSGFGLGTFVSIFVELLAVLVVLSLVGVLVIVVVANRADPDPSGRRPQSVYFFVVSFVTLTIAIFGSALVVAGIAALVANHSSSVSNGSARAIVFGALATIVSMFLLLTHLRRGMDLVRADGQSPGPSRRVGQSYVASVAFVSVLAFFVLFVFSAYLIFALAAPGVFGSIGSQSDTTRVLVVAVYLVAVSAIVWESHRKLVTPELDLVRDGGRSAGSAEARSTESED